MAPTQTARYPLRDIPDTESLTATIVKITVEYEGTGKDKRIKKKRFFMLNDETTVEVFCLNYEYDDDGDLISQTRDCSGW